MVKNFLIKELIYSIAFIIAIIGIFWIEDGFYWFGYIAIAISFPLFHWYRMRP